MELPVDASRLRADIEANAEFGRIEDGDSETRGRTNRTGTEANRAARDRLVARFEDAGLDIAVDAVGNLLGTWTADSADPDAAPVVSGSHLDSVPEGGIFDGPLGVYAALEAVRAMQDAGVEPDRPVAVVGFTEEEGGTFGNGLLGSAVATGELAAEDALGLTSADEIDGLVAGETLGEALDRIGYRGDDAVEPATWEAFYELHIEQDTVLETADADAGVVTTITGITHCEATIEGEANHAGATAMGDRTDALAAASEFVLDVEAAANEVVERDSDSAVGTVGSLSVSPNATNVVPGRVDAGVDVRDVESESMETIVAAARDSLDRLERERGVETSIERPFDVAPTPMSERLRKAAHDAADEAGRTAIDLHSGAAHDAMRVARVTDASLLFAPSRDGVSHNPREWTDWEDCAAATEVLAGAVARSAGATAQSGGEE
ncbi:amidase, hydantoinase/carbamoylase family protein [Halorubrum aidingense JCM 13560]|uniref:Amidase, hydantoinase/carbamoylase family protein n=1 Tax=Halorubrum aidingense JCM 13560 TaxID=1230454 RepID=M0PHK8_9EURY|nr:Zn-dependent hydrolase [Halorubrum aidingense]EMA68270.1 amidase, hydantoinase/carbamoylase family protein [Halorubrum aidingense JCM 13560]